MVINMEAKRWLEWEQQRIDAIKERDQLRAENEKLKDLVLAYENDLVLLSVYGKLKRAEERIEELETYIDDCQSKPCYANKKEEARKKINDILAHALTERKEDYYLDGKYFRLGKLEKDIMEVVDNIFVDGGNENAK